MKNLLLLLIVVLLAAFPLFLHHEAAEVPTIPTDVPLPTNGESVELFAGADGLAEDMIGQINPDYEPWFASLWEPPSGEIESLLFVLQAVIGSGALFYFLGFIRGRNITRQRD